MTADRPLGRTVAVLGFCCLLFASGCGKQPAGGRVAVIGLDGATWEILQPWIERGDLPTLARLQQEGAWGELQSAVPYLSPPAWTTAITGVNPGKHAVFDFQRRVPGQRVIVNETAKSRRAQPIWKMLEQFDRRALLLNIPMTDPPDPLDGLFVAGFPHMDWTGFTYPPELEAQLGDYDLDRLEMKLVPGTEDSLLDVYYTGMRQRARVTLDWIANEPFDLMWIVFTGTDRIQHTFWGFSDPQNPNYDPERAARYGTAIHDFWVEQDRRLGEIIAALGPETTVMLVSDHGFGPLRYDLRLQNYLHSAESDLPAELADQVYVLDPGDAARIYIARRGRDPGAPLTPADARQTRDRVADLLRQARDPRTGERVLDAVWANEDVFSGTYAEKGPDLVALPARGYFMTLGQKDVAASDGAIVPHGPYLSGWHLMNGIYAVRGPSIVPGRRDGDDGELYSLLDLVPTLLYLLGEPVPEGLDGGVMRGVIDPARWAARPPESCPPLEEDYRELTPDELKNLRNLPYIGS